MTWKLKLIGFIGMLLWPPAILAVQAQDGNGVPDEIDLFGRMYWTDSGTDKIQRANLDESNVEDLVTGLNEVRGIALDPAAGKIYWVDFWTDKIQRANLDGSNVSGTDS